MISSICLLVVKNMCEQGKRPHEKQPTSRTNSKIKCWRMKCDRVKALYSLVFRLSTCTSHNVLLPKSQMTGHIAMTISDRP